MLRIDFRDFTFFLLGFMLNVVSTLVSVLYLAIKKRTGDLPDSQTSKPSNNMSTEPFSSLCSVQEGELLEALSGLEHEQWMTWSKNVAQEVSEERRRRWEGYWVPYAELSEGVKEWDRVWARKALKILTDHFEVENTPRRILPNSLGS